MEEILAKFFSMKEEINPLTGKHIPQNKRIEAMIPIIRNKVYGKEYNKDERICAAQVIIEILKEKNK